MGDRGVFVDSSYRTMLGTSFYDRVWELEKLEEMVRALRTVVVYGPRNVGKSELVRYLVRRRLGKRLGIGFAGRVVVVDSRKRAVEHIAAPGASRVALELGELVSQALGLPRGLVGLLESLTARLRPPLLVFIDEFHLLARSREAALAELEAAAGFLAKRGEEQARLVVTVSEGFFATSRAVSRLQGYSTGYLLVEPMELEGFRRLYEEYTGRHGCSLDLKEFLGLAGPSPGYLVDLCPRRGELLLEWVAVELQKLLDALSMVSERLGVEEREAAARAASLLQGRPPASQLERKLGEALVEENIAYPCHSPHRRYLPQLPLYLTALEAVSRQGSVSPHMLLHSPRRAAELPRCRTLSRAITE